MRNKQPFIHGRKRRLTSLQKTLTDFTNGAMIPKAWTDSDYGIAVRGQQEFFNGGTPKHLLYRPSLKASCVQMHVAERQSIPNLPAVATQAAGLPQVFAFDSLKSLPHRDYLQPHYESQQQPAGKFHLGPCSGVTTLLACFCACQAAQDTCLFLRGCQRLASTLHADTRTPCACVYTCLHACRPGLHGCLPSCAA